MPAWQTDPSRPLLPEEINSAESPPAIDVFSDLISNDPMPLPLDIRKKPIDVKVHISSGTGVDITWSDAHTSHYEFAYLREHCPCATCREEHGKREGKSSHVASFALPMFKAKVTARAASPVGNYAVQIEFSDGHSTGIYSFDHLREICPCESCGREFRAAPAQ